LRKSGWLLKHRMSKASWAAALGALLLAACSAEPDSNDSTSDEDLGGRRYVDVNADEPMAGVAKTKMQSALGRLARVAKESQNEPRRALAAETLARIDGGDVRLGSIQAARGIDRWHMCKDEVHPACTGPAPASDDRTWLGDVDLAKRIEEGLAGYQWGNRIYFSITKETDVDELAATLVHEVVHVRNRSECSYYSNVDAHVVDANPAYIEEYRSFLTDCFYADEAATAATCSVYAKEQVDGYGFATTVDDSAALTARLMSEASFYPRRDGWPTAFGACSL